MAKQTQFEDSEIVIRGNAKKIADGIRGILEATYVNGREMSDQLCKKDGVSIEALAAAQVTAFLNMAFGPPVADPGRDAVEAAVRKGLERANAKRVQPPKGKATGAN